MAGKRAPKTYVNLKYKFIRGLINEEKYERKKHWMKHAAEWTSRAITTMDLSQEVVKNVRQATALDGIGDKAGLKLGRISVDKRFSSDPPSPGMFVSSASALLVALYFLDRDAENTDMLDGSMTLISEDELKRLASAICEEKFEETSESSGVFCKAWWRLTLLASRGYVKKRTRNKKPVYQLLDEGKEMAQELLEGRGLDKHSVQDILAGQPVDQKAVQAAPEMTAAEQEHLYTNHDETDGVLMYVDLQEGGGQNKGLSGICRQMQRIGVRYATRRLVTGDYSWVWAYGGQKIELPILVERKRADDLAKSLVDGRYQRQKEKMLTWASKYAEIGVETVLTYLVEGDPAAYVVQCADGCGGVGRCGNPSVLQLQLVMRELSESLDFRLVETSNIMGTVDYLVSVTQDLQRRVESGDFDGLLSLAENLKDVPDNNATRSTPTKKTAKRSGKKSTKENDKDIPPETKEDVRRPNTKQTRKKYMLTELAVMEEITSSEDDPIVLDTTPDRPTSKKKKTSKHSDTSRVKSKSSGKTLKNGDARKPFSVEKSEFWEETDEKFKTNFQVVSPVKKVKRRVHHIDEDLFDLPELANLANQSENNKNCVSPSKRHRWGPVPHPATSTSNADDVILIDSPPSDVKHEIKPKIGIFPSTSGYGKLKNGDFKSESESNDTWDDSDDDIEELPTFDSNVRRGNSFSDSPKYNPRKYEENGGLDDFPKYDPKDFESQEYDDLPEYADGGGFRLTEGRSEEKEVEGTGEEKWKDELKQIREIIPDADLEISVSLLEHHLGKVENVISTFIDELS